jgi:hypothetical protein
VLPRRAAPPLLCSQKYHTSFGGDLAARKKEYQDMVNKYYDLATSFYEYGEDARPGRWRAHTKQRAKVFFGCTAPRAIRPAA